MKKKIVLSCGMMFGVLVIVLYVVQLNSTTALAWRIAETEQQVVQLKHQNTALQTQAYRAVPLLKLQELASFRNFEKVTSITYIRLPNGLVAQSQ